MAWQVIGFMHPGTPRKIAMRGQECYGPLPRKLWVKSPIDRRHRVARPSRLVGKVRRTGKQAYEATAIEYCRWRAKRDGIAIPSGAAGRALWADKHISAVMFGAYGIRIDIPNYNWEPIEPIEETIRPGDELVRWVEFALAA